MPEPIAAFGEGSLQDLIRQQLELLELMFDDSGLARLRQRYPTHPAVEQHDQLSSLSERGLLWPNDFELVHAFAKVGLDLLVWAPKNPYGDIWEVVGRDNSTVPRLRDPSQYQDVMAELFVWGWLVDQGVPARRIQADGASDVLMKEEWPIEVKRLHVETGSGRVEAVLKKANKQIKRTNTDGGGSVYIGVERNPHRQALDDRIPNDVLPVIEAVRAALNRGLLRSVTQVIVGWDDVMILGEPPGRVLYAFRRRSTLVAHPDPRVPPQFSRENLEFGRTVTATVEYSTASIPDAPQSYDPIDTHDAAISPLFRDQNDFPQGVRANHAVEAIAEPDSIKRLHYDGIEVAFATRKIAQQEQAYVLLAIAMRKDGEKFQLVGGYRLYRPQKGVDIGFDALAAFEVLLERYGLEVSIGDQKGLFIASALAPPGAGLAFAEGSDNFATSALIKHRSDGYTEYGAIFAIDSGRYRTALSQRQS